MRTGLAKRRVEEEDRGRALRGGLSFCWYRGEKADIEDILTDAGGSLLKGGLPCPARCKGILAIT